MESYKECSHWSPGLEVDESEQEMAGCKKNPGHNTFIPIREFRLERLPLEWQIEDYFKFIKVYSDLTVRLRVPHLSSAGQPGGGQRVGTGLVIDVKPTPGHCPCPKCKGQTDQRSWTFTIGTAKHVVNDDSEFGLMWVDFYYDDDKSSADGRMKQLMGGSVVFTRDELDWRKFECLCHDEVLAVQMMDQLRERERLWDSLREWLNSLSPRPAIFVSHPHGRPKCVTVGEERGYDWDSRMYTYTTDTCPGSSGSFMVGWGLLLWGPHHCQAGEGGLNIGFDSFWSVVL